ncbi:hypothetical protein GCM10023168_15940 [Fodinibacter luteus]|uniref:Uncharacterized protein n=2 Tax=Fodinibacter luteus TaxID=552064 RepID=A0ABP8KBY7_9MICO
MQRPGRADRTTASVLLGGVTAFQLALAAGAPWGRLAWGGGHEGTLPIELRVSSGVAALLWGAATVAVAAERPRSARGQRVLLRGLGGVCGLGAALNLASPSRAERAVWAPVSAAAAVLTWRVARAVVVTDGSAGRAG